MEAAHVVRAPARSRMGRPGVGSQIQHHSAGGIFPPTGCQPGREPPRSVLLHCLFIAVNITKIEAGARGSRERNKAMGLIERIYFQFRNQHYSNVFTATIVSLFFTSPKQSKYTSKPTMLYLPSARTRASYASNSP